VIEYSTLMQSTIHVYEVRPRKDKRGFDLLSDALPFGRLWYDTSDNAVGYAMHNNRSHAAVIRGSMQAVRVSVPGLNLFPGFVGNLSMLWFSENRIHR
jgi:hypothetical protein